MWWEILLIKTKAPLPSKAALLTTDRLPLESVLQEGAGGSHGRWKEGCSMELVPGHADEG